MPIIDSVQKYLDDICPSASTVDGISARLGWSTNEILTALSWLIVQRRAVAVMPAETVDGVAVPGVVQYQSTKLVRSTSRGFSGTMD